MRETKFWTWHILAGVIILLLLGLHMITMHLDGILGWFNPAGGDSIEWSNVLARAKMTLMAAVYTVLLAAALYHGLYGFRTILFELGLKTGAQKFINVVFWIFGTALFVYGTWAAFKFQMIAQAG